MGYTKFENEDKVRVPKKIADKLGVLFHITSTNKRIDCFLYRRRDMKKLYVSSVSILFAVLCLVFTACNGMTAGKGTGTVRVVIGGGQPVPLIPPVDCRFFTKIIQKLPLPKQMGLRW